MINKQQDIRCISNKHKVSIVFIYFLSLVLSLSVSAQDSPSGYKISSPVSGVIKMIYVKPGQVVKKGDLLLEYDDSLIAGNLSEAQAKIKLAILNQAEAKKNYERAVELYDRTVLSEQELQQEKIAFTKASAQYAAAKNQLIHARWNMSHIKLYATINGQVSEVFSYPGQYVNNNFSAQTLLIIK